MFENLWARIKLLDSALRVTDLLSLVDAQHGRVELTASVKKGPMVLKDARTLGSTIAFQVATTITNTYHIFKLAS